jgi:hypothetical protein
MRVGTTAIAAQVLAVPLTSPRKRAGRGVRQRFSSGASGSEKNSSPTPRELQLRGTSETHRRYLSSSKLKEADMGFGRGTLLWLIGIPLPIILILALFMHH